MIKIGINSLLFTFEMNVKGTNVYLFSSKLSDEYLEYFKGIELNMLKIVNTIKLIQTKSNKCKKVNTSSFYNFYYIDYQPLNFWLYPDFGRFYLVTT